MRESATHTSLVHAHGTHLIAYFIVASDCGWSTLPEVKERIGGLREKLLETHGAEYSQISVVAVALDRDLDAGLQLISDLGGGDSAAFDQIVVGGSWLNELVLKLVWREGLATAATPQIVVVERRIDSSSYESESKIRVADDDLLVNHSGSAEIGEWFERGLPLNRVTYGSIQSRQTNRHPSLAQEPTPF